MSVFMLLLIGYSIGYVFSRVWRTGRPEKISIAALVVGWIIGREQRRERNAEWRRR